MLTDEIKDLLDEAAFERRNLETQYRGCQTRVVAAIPGKLDILVAEYDDVASFGRAWPLIRVYYSGRLKGLAA